jgi:tetratricopeptide (TPR) repeat protein
MNKFLKRMSAVVVLLACASVPCAWAQQGPDVKNTESVRERRVSPAEAQKGSSGSKPESKPEPKLKGELNAKGEPQGRGELTTPVKSSAQTPTHDDASIKDKALPVVPVGDVEAATRVESGANESGTNESGAEIEALRAQADSASNPAERGRLRQALAERLAQTGRRAEAVELLRSMLVEERFDPPFFYNTGNALARLGASDAAADAYRKAVAQRHGNYARAQHNLGVVLTRLGRWEEAQEALTTALKLENYTYAEASYSLGRLHALRGETGLAVAEWTRTLRLKPDHTDAAVALARALAEGGDVEQALAVLDAFGKRAGLRGATLPREVTVARGEIVAASNLAASRREHGDGLDESDFTLTSVVERRAGAERVTSKSSTASTSLPDSTAVLRGARVPHGTLAPPEVGKQAYTLLLSARAARADERGAEAIALYRRAIDANGGYLAVANIELGLAFVSMRRNEEAAASMLAVVRKDGARYPLVFYHLGRLYEHLGRLGEAGESFARAAELMGEESPQFFVDLSRVREREGLSVDALSAAEQYVRVMGRSGDVPEWALARVESLRKKASQDAAAQPSPAKH